MDDSDREQVSTNDCLVICYSIIRNIAFYRAGWTTAENGNKQLVLDDDFWRTVNGNFLEMAALNWCKLFFDRGGKHHWKCILPVEHHEAFREKLLSSNSLTEEDYREKSKLIGDYRNKHLAHADHRTKLFYPETELLLKSAEVLLNTLTTIPDLSRHIIGAYSNAEQYYENWLSSAQNNITKYKSLTG